jgi:ATP-dependent Clp protease adaptor protein ClpS
VEGQTAWSSDSQTLEHIDEPHAYRVIMFNDDYTTKEFVVQVLVLIFHKTDEEAFLLMEKIHKTGSAIVGVYAYDVAATYIALVKSFARESGFPLRCEMEET